MSVNPRLHNKGHHNLLSQPTTQIQDGIKISTTEDASTHTATLSFLDQTITTTHKTKERQTRA